MISDKTEKINIKLKSNTGNFTRHIKILTPLLQELDAKVMEQGW